MIELPISVAAPAVSHGDALADGTRLGEFEIRGLIGVGGFGMVYKAYDHSLQRDVAIKEYMPTALAGRADGSLHISVRTSNDHETFQKGLRSFVAEARLLAKFEHPSLVRVFRFWEANDTAYMSAYGAAEPCTIGGSFAATHVSTNLDTELTAGGVADIPTICATLW